MSTNDLDDATSPANLEHEAMATETRGHTSSSGHSLHSLHSGEASAAKGKAGGSRHVLLICGGDVVMKGGWGDGGMAVYWLDEKGDEAGS